MPMSDAAMLRNWVSCSRQLSQTIKRPEHLANPFCNILNCTTKTAAGYPDLLGRKPAYWRLFKSIAGAAFTWCRACFYWPRALSLNLSEKQVDVVFVSHLISESHLDKEADFYFADLAEALENEGFSTHTVLINHIKAGRNISPGEKRSVLPAFLSPLKEAGIIFRLFLSAFSLPRGDNARSAHFCRLAKLSQFGNRAIGDYRIGMMLGEIIRASSPKAVIHTYEGHGWERLLADAAHKMDTSVKVFGYQHAVIFPGPKAILQNRGVAMPDHIFTTGEAAKTMLAKEGELPKTYFSILGSSKVFNAKPSAQFSPKGACLIAPEGTLGEVKLMAKLCIDAARSIPEQQFILRLHPVLSREHVVNLLKEFNPIPDNFTLSQASLDEDMERSSWLCYRGSTVAFQGIVAGLRPIFLDTDQAAANNDPLPSGLAFRRTCTSGDALTALIIDDRKVAEPDQTAFHEAVDFARSYLMPLMPDRLKEKIKAL